MSRKLPPIGSQLKSRRAMLETLVRNLHMVRLTVAAVASFVAIAGCTGLVDNHSGSDSPAVAAAKEAWTSEALPALTAGTCVGCHASQAGQEFLKGPDVRATLIDFSPQVVNLDAPGSSRIVTKGAHSGPALSGDQVTSILDWIKLEKDAATDPGPDEPDLEIAPFAPVLCPMGTTDDMCPTNDLDLAVVGLAGAKLHFTAEALPSGLYIKNLKVIAATDGAYVEHPLFVSWPSPTNPVPDSIDRFFDVKLDLMANATDYIDGGTAAFLGFVPTDQISIHFKAVKPYQDPNAMTGGGTTTTGATGCRQLGLFKMATQGQLQTNCASCHAGGNGNATSAMNITTINSTDDTMLQTACNQVRSRINFQTTDQSGFYIAPDPNSGTSHQFKFASATAFQAFKSAIDPWVQAEKTSP